MNIKLSYPLKYASIFSIVTALVAIKITTFSQGGWENLWIYTSSSAFIVCYVSSYFLIAKKENYTNLRLFFVAIFIALFSHWVFWYGLLVFGYFESIVQGYGPDSNTINPLDGLYIAIVYSFLSLFFFGWISIPVSIFLSFFLKPQR